MEMIAIVIIVALIQFMGFSIAVGRARKKHGVPAPATTGNEEFERYFRIQQNTLEQLVIVIPLLAICGLFSDPLWAAVAGLVFVIGRQLYYFGYAKDPNRRSLGFGVGFFATVYLFAAGLVGVVQALA